MLHCGRPLCREDTLTQLFLASIRKGKEAEIELAAKALGLHVATLGASTASEGIYQEVCWGLSMLCRCAVQFVAEQFVAGLQGGLLQCR